MRVPLGERNAERACRSFTVAQIPALAGTVDLNPVDHSSGKRLWVLVEPHSDTTKRVLLWDDDNDGVFDSHETKTFNDCTNPPSGFGRGVLEH